MLGTGQANLWFHMFLQAARSKHHLRYAILLPKGKAIELAKAPDACYSFCSEVGHITLAHISLAKASPMTQSGGGGTGKCTPAAVDSARHRAKGKDVSLEKLNTIYYHLMRLIIE